MKNDKLYLVHIVECVEKIEKYTVEGKESFVLDEKTQDAVLRNLHTLAESSTRVSEQMQSKYPEVAWQEIGAFRNVVVHDYLGLELEQIWDIVVVDLPPLKKSILTMLKEF
jgi:uncharacterized protein with HEPN domain